MKKIFIYCLVFSMLLCSCKIDNRSFEEKVGPCLYLDVTNPPNKTAYKYEEEFDKTGMCVMGYTSYSYFVDVTASCTTEFNVEKNTVIISFNGASTTYPVSFTDKLASIGEKRFSTLSTLKTYINSTSGEYTINFYSFLNNSQSNVNTCLKSSKSTFTLDLSKCTSVTSILKSAFSSNTKMKAVVFPNTLTGIGESAFSGCTSLKTVDLPSTLKTIGTDAFKYVASCTFNYDGNYSSFVNIAGKDVILELTSGTLKCKDKTVTLPLKTAVATVGSKEFYTFAELKTYLSSTATSETTVVVQSSKPSLDDLSTCLSNSKVLVNLDLSKCTGITATGSSFYNKAKLKSIILPEGLTTISSTAFNYCSNLTKIVLPSTLTTMPSSTPFYNDTSLTRIEYNGTYTKFKAITNYKILKNVTNGYLYCSDRTVKCSSIS